MAASTSVPKSFGPSGTDGTSGWTPGLPNPKGVAQSKGAVDTLSWPFPKTPAEPKAKAEPKTNAWAEYAGVKPGNTAKLVTKIESPFPPVPPFPKGATHFDDRLLHPKTKSKDELFVAGEYYTGKSYLLPGVVEGIVKTGRDEISRLQGPAGLPMGIPAVRPVLASEIDRNLAGDPILKKVDLKNVFESNSFMAKYAQSKGRSQRGSAPRRSPKTDEEDDEEAPDEEDEGEAECYSKRRVASPIGIGTMGLVTRTTWMPWST